MAAKPFASSADLADKPQTLEVVADGVYALTAGGDPNVGAIEAEDFLVCVEATATPVAAREWLAKLREHTDKPIRYLVLTHYHAVRTLGASAFGGSAVVAHRNTRALIAERGRQDWESELARMPRLFKQPESIPGLTWPTVTFTDQLDIDLGGDRGPLVLRHLGRGHTEGDIVAWLPRQRILFAGDLVEARAALYTGDAYHREWMSTTLDAVAALGARSLIGGRGPVVHGAEPVRQAVAQTRRFLNVLLAEVAAVHAVGGTLREAFGLAHAALAPEYGGWPIFEHCLPFDVARAWEELEGVTRPTIWTPARDRAIWDQLQGGASGGPPAPRGTGSESGGWWPERDRSEGPVDVTVVVVGAGPVGLATALLLARWGVPSVVCEAEPRHEAVGSRSICTQRDVIDVFDRIGCAAPLLAEGVTWRVGRTFYRHHELFTVEFPEVGGALPPWINISQASVERHLLDRVAAEPAVELRRGHRVHGLEQNADQVTVHTTHGTVTGDYLVGADGAHSAVRELLGVDFPGHSYRDKFLIADIRCDLPFPRERRFHFDPEWNPGRQVLVHQCPDGVWRIDWQVPPDFDLARETASGRLDERIRKITGGRRYEVVWRTVYRFHERCADRFRVGRAFLAGDAAHLFAPFGARGLNSGILDAENLAWKLGFAYRGWAGPALLDSYHAERHPAALENLRVTSETMRFLAPQTDAEWRRRRDALRRAVTDPDARAAIDSGKLAEPYWYLDSPLTTPGLAVDFPTGPGAARPPVPGVLCPDAPLAAGGRLRQFFGYGFALLSAAPVARPPTDVPVSAHRLDGPAREVLRATDTSVHLVRPDGHLAAVLPAPDPVALAAAVTTATGGLGHAPPG